MIHSCGFDVRRKHLLFARTPHDQDMAELRRGSFTGEARCADLCDRVCIKRLDVGGVHTPTMVRAATRHEVRRLIGNDICSGSLRAVVIQPIERLRI